MRSIQTGLAFPLSSVKPLEKLETYRAFCLEAVKKALGQGARRTRSESPVTGARLEPAGEVGGLSYARCPDTGSLFLRDVASRDAWAGLLSQVVRYRHSPAAFHTEIAGSRAENVYAPKLEWVRNALSLQDLKRPKILEVSTPPSDFAGLLEKSGAFQSVQSVDEMALASGRASLPGPVDAAVLLESLDRVDDPKALLEAVRGALSKGGVLCLTALVSSGFDMAVLSLNNLYLYPPDRTNCFSLRGLEALVSQAGFKLIEVSTPGVLDLEIVRAHLRHGTPVRLSAFEELLISRDRETQADFQTFLQQRGLSSFARIVGRKT